MNDKDLSRRPQKIILFNTYAIRNYNRIDHVNMMADKLPDFD